MQSKATTVAAYLAELPEDRRAALTALRDLIRKHIDPGFSEGVGYGMIGWSVPHSRYPAGYHCNPKDPLPFAGLASQKNYMSLYICPPSMGEVDAAAEAEADWFRAAWAKTGKKLDMGKACLRFKRVEDLALDVIGEAIRRVPAAAYIERYQAVLASTGKGAKQAGSKPAPVKKAAAKKPAAAKPKAVAVKKPKAK